MKFRPCIDIHNGAVKQIVGSSLKDQGDQATENFVASEDAASFASLYRDKGLSGGHVILLNAKSSPYYEKTKEQALSALSTYPGGLQVGGGMNPDTGREFLDAGAAALIVTSYLFDGKHLDRDRLRKCKEAFGRDRLVIDLSCRRKDDKWYVVTDRWQTFTDAVLSYDLLSELSESCFEFLIHGVDVEGKGSGMDHDLVAFLSGWKDTKITYAGGVASIEDLLKFRKVANDRLDLTIGSALSIFGGGLSMEEVIEASEVAL